MYRSDSYKCTFQLSKYLHGRDRAVWFSFDHFACHEKSFEKYQAKTINYTTSKNFSNEKYWETLINNLSKENFINNDGFQRICHISLDALDKHTPCNKKHAQSNQMPFFNKELLKAIMTKTKLWNIFLQNRSVENICYTKQRNFCVSLLRKTKKRLWKSKWKVCCRQ